MEAWILGVTNTLQPINLLAIGFGVIFGIVVGAMPGLSSTMGVALIIPFTFYMEPATGLILLAAVYCASVYAGSIAAILLNTPGTPAAAATLLDGYELTRNGQSGIALGTSAIASTFGGIFSAIVLSTLAPWLARQAVRFGPPEYFALAVFGLTIISSLTGKNPIKGLVAGAFGILIATIGMDPINGFPRYTFDRPELLDGFSLIPVLIGLFSASQGLVLIASTLNKQEATVLSVSGRTLPPLSELRRLLPNLLRSSVIGTALGIVPGVGGGSVTFIAYNEAMRWSKHREKFGTGIIDGVAAPEAANNAVTGGALVPMLTLGIPGNTVSAVFLGGLLIHGLRPGPMLFQNSGPVVYSLFFSLILTNVLFGVIGIVGAKYFARVLKVPAVILGPSIMLLSVVGSYAIHNNFTDVWVMFAFGIVGYLLRLYKVPLAPIVLAIILGPMAEQAYNQSMLMSGGDGGIFFSRPISAVFLIIAIITFFTPFVVNWRERRKASKE